MSDASLSAAGLDLDAMDDDGQVNERAEKRMLGVNIDIPTPGQIVTCSVIPQIAFRLERLVVPDACKDAVIHAIRIGGKDALAGPSPASVFSPMGAGVQQFAMPASPPGEPIEIDVSMPRIGTFHASFIGTRATAPREEPLITTAKAALEYGKSLEPIPSPKSIEEEMREEIDKFFPPIPPLEGDPPP
jgi:hypothetical protein